MIELKCLEIASESLLCWDWSIPKVENELSCFSFQATWMSSSKNALKEIVTANERATDQTHLYDNWASFRNEYHTVLHSRVSRPWVGIAKSNNKTNNQGSTKEQHGASRSWTSWEPHMVWLTGRAAYRKDSEHMSSTTVHSECAVTVTDKVTAQMSNLLVVSRKHKDMQTLSCS